MWAHARGHRADGRGDNNRVCGGRADRGDPQRRIGCLGEHDERNDRADQHHSRDRAFDHHTCADKRVGDPLAAGRGDSNGHHASNRNDTRAHTDRRAHTDTETHGRTDQSADTDHHADTDGRTSADTDRRAHTDTGRADSRAAHFDRSTTRALPPDYHSGPASSRKQRMHQGPAR